MDYRSIGIRERERARSHICSEIISLENLLAAWNEFKQGKRARVDVQRFELNLEDNIFGLREELLAKNYQPAPYTGFYITDPKLRHIHKACVCDRVLHHAIYRVLLPVFEPSFIHDSYACRVGKGSHRAVKRLATFARRVSQNYRRNCYALKCDVRKFFDSVDHGVLSRLLARNVGDPDCLWLLDRIITSFNATCGKGIPIGNVTSQLFANVYLNELDQFMKHRLKAKFYIRYCDDFVILHHDRGYLESLVPRIDAFLGQELKLSLHPNKVSIRTLNQGIDFLGYVVRPRHAVLRTRTKRRMIRRLSYVAGAVAAGKVEASRYKLSLQSYLGMLRHCCGYNLSRFIFSLCSRIVQSYVRTNSPGQGRGYPVQQHPAAGREGFG